MIEVNELQKRRVIGKLKRHLGSLHGQEGRAARARVQAEHRRHARGAVDRARVAAARRRRDACAPGTRLRTRRSCRAASRLPRRCSRRLRGADAAVIVTEWDELKGLASAGGARGDAQAADRRRPQPARSRRDARAPASPTRASAARRATDVLPSPSRRSLAHGGDHPRRRQGRAARRCGRRPAEGARRGRRQAARGVPGRRGSRRRASTRVIFACAAGQGDALRARARRASARRSSPRRSPSGSAAAAGSGSPRASRARERRPVRAERRRARRRRLRRAARPSPASGRRWRRSPSRGRSRRSGWSTLDEGDVVDGFSEARPRPVLGELRHLRALGGGARRASRSAGDHESTTFPELAAEGALLRLPPRGPLADREHAEGAAGRRPSTSQQHPEWLA